MKKKDFRSTAVTEGILEYLKSENQENLLPEVTKTLELEIEKSKIAEKIVVRSTTKLSSEQLGKIKNIIGKFLYLELPVMNIIDKNLLGGFTIKVNDWFYDGSLLHGLTSLKRSLIPQ